MNDSKNGSVKYSAASQVDPKVEISDDGDEANPEKSERSCCQKCSIYSCALGFVFILAGIICAGVMKPVIENKILSKLPLVEGSVVYSSWKYPPVTPVLFLRLFNLTNEKEFLAGREKPRLVELGPYAYRQKLEKTNVEFGPGGDTVRHEVKRRYYFSQQLSGPGVSESDVIVVPNVPLFGAMKKMEAESGMAKEVFKAILGGFEFANDTKPFVRVTVKEFLWGYPSILMTLNRNQAQGCQDARSVASDEEGFGEFEDWGFDYEENKPKQQQKKEKGGGGSKGKQAREAKPRPECDIAPGKLAQFGLFKERNGTSLDPREINTGVSNLTEKGLMISWLDMRKLTYWGENGRQQQQQQQQSQKPQHHNHPQSEPAPDGSSSSVDCNQISHSRDPGIMPVDLQKGQTLHLFIGNLGRTIEFKYSHEVKIDQFRTYRFIPQENSFDGLEDNPDNACYCVGKRRRSGACLPSGLHDNSPANPRSPVVMSWPHFLYGDPDLKRAVEGMRPDSKKHTFYFDVEPTYGVTMAALAKLQMNVEVVKDSGFGYFDDIIEDRVFLPFAWVEEGIMGPSDVVKEKVQMLLMMPKRVRNLMALIGMVLGIILLIPEIFYWVKSCFNRKKPEEEEGEGDSKEALQKPVSTV